MSLDCQSQTARAQTLAFAQNFRQRSKIMHKTMIILSLCLMLGVSACRDRVVDAPIVLPADTLAHAGAEALSADQVRSAFKAVLWEDRSATGTLSAEAVAGLARPLLVERALASEARRLGGEQDAGYQAALRMATGASIAAQSRGGLKFEMIGPDPPRAEMELFMEKFKEWAYIPQVRANFIFLRAEGMTPEQRAAQRERAEQARRRVVEGGEKFEDVLMEVSEAQNKSTEAIVFTPDLPNLDPDLWELLASMKPLEVSEVLESAAGFHIFYVTRSTVIRPDMTFAEFNLSPVSRFYFQQLLKAPINRLHYAYGARTPVALRSPAGPLPAGDDVLVEVGDRRWTMADLQAINRFEQGPPLDRPGLIRRMPQLLELTTLNERAARLGIEEFLLEGPQVAQARAQVHARFLVQRLRETLEPPSRVELDRAAESWSHEYVGHPVVVGARLLMRPRPAEGEQPLSPLAVREQALALREQLLAADAPRELVEDYQQPGIELEVEPQGPELLEHLQKQDRRWPYDPASGDPPLVSEPVLTPRGWLMFVVEQSRPAEQWEKDELRPLIGRIVTERRAVEAVEAIQQRVHDQLQVNTELLGSALPARLEDLLEELPPPPQTPEPIQVEST